MSLANASVATFVVLYWTKVFSRLTFEHDVVHSCSSRAGPFTCLETSNRDLLPNASVAMFHGRDVDLGDLPDARAAAHHVPWVYYSWENPLADHYPCLPSLFHLTQFDACHRATQDESVMAMFGGRMTYATTDLPGVSYFNDYANSTDPYYLENGLVKIYQVRQKQAHASSPLGSRKDAVAWIASNCASFSGREYYIEQLAKFYPVHSFGKCLHSQDWPEGVDMHEIYRQYKFVFALENTNCDDYVTEKILNAYASGAIPIVDGPDDYSHFTPWGNVNSSVIKLDSFSEGPAQLAKHLHSLASLSEAELRARFFPHLYDHSYSSARSAEHKSKYPEQTRTTPGCVKCETMRDRFEEIDHGHASIDRSCVVSKWFRSYYSDGTMGASSAGLHPSLLHWRILVYHHHVFRLVTFIVISLLALLVVLRRFTTCCNCKRHRKSKSKSKSANKCYGWALPV